MSSQAAIFNLGILTVSDAGSKGERADTSGDAISEIMAGQGFREALRDIMPDERDLISARLRDWCDGGEVDLILTTGGTGLAPRDVDALLADHHVYLTRDGRLSIAGLACKDIPYVAEAIAAVLAKKK